MTNEEFKALWDVLNAEYGRRADGGKITELHHGGKIDFARKVQADIDEWCDELVARAKAEFENERFNFEALQKAAGDTFDKIEPNRVAGLKFES